MSDIHGGPADVIGRLRAAEPRETVQAEFETGRQAADARTWPGAGVDTAYVCARAEVQGVIDDRRAEARKGREWAEAGDSFAPHGFAPVFESDATRSARIAADEDAVLDRARAQWARYGTQPARQARGTRSTRYR